MEYTYVIIDSDATSNLQLQHYLEEYGDFACTALTKSSSEGLDQILKKNPDIVFVNINKSAKEYFQMVTELHQYFSEIPVLIAISNTKEYAYEAIKSNFFDYWLLPYNEFDIRKTILRLKKKIAKESTSPMLCLKSYQDYRYLDTDEILYLKADNNATDFFMKDGTTISAYKTLKSFEDQLPKNFVRVHQSYILNTAYISRIDYGKSICAIKGGKMQLPFSKSYKENIDELKRLLAKNTIGILN